MPNIYDNIDKQLVDALCGSLEHASRIEVCVGYFNLRGWRELAPYVDKLETTIRAANVVLQGRHYSRHVGILAATVPSPHWGEPERG